MKVFLTGGTGFVGANTALALLEAGHEVRLLVRNAEAAKKYFLTHGFEIDDLVVADMLDVAAVKAAMQGCDAVLHAAAAVSLDPNKAQQTYDTNVGGMKSVLGSACELGIKSIVYVSSISVLMQTGFEVINEQTPLANTREPYSRSKRDSDEYVRSLQRDGHPVQITYPSAIVGPNDPRMSEANHAMIQFISQFMPNTSSGFQCVDVRDLAAAHRFLLENPPTMGFEDARYVVGGHYYPWTDFRQKLEQASGHRVFSLPIPGLLLRAMGEVVDVIKKLIPFQTPVSGEAMGYVTQWTEADSAKLLRHTGMKFRNGDETFRDMIRWMVAEGHMDKKFG